MSDNSMSVILTLAGVALMRLFFKSSGTFPKNSRISIAVCFELGVPSLNRQCATYAVPIDLEIAMFSIFRMVTKIVKAYKK